MRLRIGLLTAALTLSSCSLFDTRPDYTGPDDYTFTLNVGCFCPYVGPLRITVQDNEVVDVRQLEPLDEHGNVDELIDEWAMTLDELRELADRARRDADVVEVEYDPTYGFPATISIDWHQDAVDDEIGYTVTDYVPS